MNEKDLVTFEQAKKLKELGFNWECLYHYDGDYLDSNGCRYNAQDVDSAYDSLNTTDWNPLEWIDAPFLYQVQNWLREEKHIHITIDTYFPNWQDGVYGFNEVKYECTVIKMTESTASRENIGKYDSHEEALSAGIDKVLELL